MEKIRRKAINQMSEILAGIVQGRLKHDQSVWHCGTAHCVAGWNTALNHKRLYRKQVKMQLEAEGLENEHELGAWDASTPDGLSDGCLAKEDWDLSSREANYMFDGDASLDEQIGLIEFLRAGHRWLDGDGTYGLPDGLAEFQRRYQGRAAQKRWADEYDAKRRQFHERLKRARKHRYGSDLVEELLVCKPAAATATEPETIEEVETVTAATAK
jgi:hypothetical protein